MNELTLMERKEVFQRTYCGVICSIVPFILPLKNGPTWVYLVYGDLGGTIFYQHISQESHRSMSDFTGSYLFRGPSNQIVDPLVSFTTENGTILGPYSLQVVWMVRQTNMVYALNDAS